MTHQDPLFFTDASDATATGTAVTALKFTAVALSAEQQRFNKLLTRTENLAKKIETVHALAQAHRSGHWAALRPLESERETLIRGMVLWLDERLQRKGLSAKQKRLASELICNLSAGLAMAGDEAMQQLHDAHSDHTLAEQQQATTADMQQMMEEMLQATKEQLEQQMQAQDEAHAKTQAARKKKAKPSARQQQAEQEAQDADGALRTIYRQLVSALHPDRESDPHEQTRKTALMKEVNAAYERRDLLALLQLQLRAALADGEMVANLAREKVAALTLLLKERAAVLTGELRDIEMHTRAEFELPHFFPLNAATLNHCLAEKLQDLQEDIAMMKKDVHRVQDDAELKRWLREQQQLTKDDFNPLDFDCFF